MPDTSTLSFDPELVADEAAQQDDRLIIQVEGGTRHAMADAALDAMRGAGVPFYQRSGALVRVALVKAKTVDGAAIDVPGIVPVTLPMLGRAMGQTISWQRQIVSGRKVVIRQVDPPKDVVEQVLAMSGLWPFPPIAGVINTPTMRPDGTILDAAGYDPATGLVLMSPPAMPRIPDRPTRHDAERALDLIQPLLAEFPFVDDASRSVALSMILTLVLRGAIPPAVPMHAAMAPEPGTGKSYLVDIASMIATGERAAVMAMGTDPAEMEKRLIAAALSGQQIIAIDNVTEMMSGDFLNQVTERPLLKIRPLGTSTDIRIPNTFTVFANGNNLSAPADMVRRTLACRLDANVENPESRVFMGNPVADVMADRGAYVAAALTIGRAYVCAECPDQLPRLASFDRWSDLVRSSLVWLGCADPCLSMQLAKDEDPIRAARSAVFLAWQKELGLAPRSLTVPELIRAVEDVDGTDFINPELREALLTIASDRNGNSVSSHRLGKWLSSNNNNVVSGIKLVADRTFTHRVRWSMARV